MILLVCESSLSNKVFGIDGFFTFNQLQDVIISGIKYPIVTFNVLSLIVYLVPMIFLFFIFLLFILMIVRKKWMPFAYMLSLFVLTIMFMGATSMVYYVLVEQGTGKLYSDVYAFFTNTILFRNVDFANINWQDQASLITVGKQFGYSVSVWLILVLTVVNLISFIEVCYAFCSKANKKQTDYNGTKVGNNYYYVSNYYASPNAKSPYASSVTKANGEPIKDKRDKNYVYPKVK